MIKFTKESEIKFISHLDLMRTIQRIIRRAKLPMEYSKGFNPHMNLSIAQPLSVGVYSKGEYLDIGFTEEVEEAVIVDSLNKNTPPAIKFLQAMKVPTTLPNEKKIPQVMALLDAARYRIKLHCSDTEELKKGMQALVEKQQWITVKKSKSGEKEVDIKPMVKEFNYEIVDNILVIDTLIACGSRENLSPELLSNYIKANTTGISENSFVEVMRQDMYTEKDEKYVSVTEYFK